MRITPIILIPTFIIALVVLTLSCTQSNNKQIESVNQPKDTVIKEPPKDTIVQFNQNSYFGIQMKGNDTAYKHITNTYKGDTLDVILQINRVDKRHLVNVDTVVIPEQLSADLMNYSPFPKRLDILNDVNKMVIFSYPIQAFGVYENGNLVRWGASSMGKKSTKTPSGLHFTNWKGRKVTSSVNSAWILEYNFNIINKIGVGWHQYDMPGYPASHSCLRLFMDDAMYLYEFSDQWILQKDALIAKGTPVLVYGDYPWGSPRPWYSLLQDGASNNLSVESLNKELEPHLTEIMDAQNQRQSIESSRSTETPAAKTDTTANMVP